MYKCSKLEKGLQEFVNVHAGIILLNEHNSDTKQKRSEKGKDIKY